MSMIRISTWRRDLIPRDFRAASEIGLRTPRRPGHSAGTIFEAKNRTLLAISDVWSSDSQPNKDAEYQNNFSRGNEMIGQS